LIGMHVGRALGLPEDRLWELYYTLLLKDVGCSSNAARICELYMTDDIAFKRDFKWVDGSFPQVVRFVLQHTGLGAGLLDKFKLLLSSMRTREEAAQELVTTRCQRGAAIARQLRFDERVAQGIHGLDEQWSGRGRPDQLAGADIPLYSRIALLAQVVDVFHTAGGPDAALEEIQARRGTWFDPALVDVVASFGPESELWDKLQAPNLAEIVFAAEPALQAIQVDEDYLDAVAAAFGEIVDSKSPYTAGHSGRVALYTDLIAAELGLSAERRRWLYRGALLHDVGKLGVSNAVLDKPGKLDAAEWDAVKQHAEFTEQILSRIPQFTELAVVAAAHHERLDGKGYPRGLSADDITAERPYRAAIPVDKTLIIMRETVGTALDAECFAALERVVVTMEDVKSSLPAPDPHDRAA
jgi:HD-GYP domain-containing protein (c-di-GMP phosphodiesterase class II)